MKECNSSAYRNLVCTMAALRPERRNVQINESGILQEYNGNMPEQKECGVPGCRKSVLFVPGILMILIGLSLLQTDLWGSFFSLAAGMLLIPSLAAYFERFLPPLEKPRIRILLIAACFLVLIARAGSFWRQTEQSGTDGLWSKVCLKDCDDTQGSRAAQMLDHIRDCGVLRDMYDVTPGSIERMQWERMVRARARILNCPNM